MTAGTDMTAGTFTAQQRGDTHAVVAGGSIAGLLAARVLADHFAQVTIVERDELPERPEFRPGVPQSRHFHGLLGRGREVLESMFPGLTAELTAAGAELLEWPTDLLSLGPAGWGRRFPTGFRVLTPSRHLLEWAIRRRVAALEGVRFVSSREAVGLVGTADGRAVCGVRLRRRARGTEARDGGSGESGEAELAADFVVDASGRGSHTPRWLEALGYAAPRESRVDAFVGYATRVYRRPPGFDADWRAATVRGIAPGDPRVGLLLPIEGERWIVTLAGYARDYPPTDEDGYREYARSLRSRVIYQAIKDAEPVTPIYGYRKTDNVLRRYDRLARWPERFVVTGDAVCAFNPIYGQGMTVAAIEAAEIGSCLREQRRLAPHGDLTGLAQRIQRRLGKAVTGPWLMATGADLRFPTTAGGRPTPTARLIQKYIDRVMAVTSEDPSVFAAFWEVVNVQAPPTRLFRPAVLRRVLVGLREAPLIEPPARQIALEVGPLGVVAASTP
jgi:2-polyprenyl-6-methoxyphenol hydroxylase-like FAD-dependent oxidoreductase